MLIMTMKSVFWNCQTQNDGILAFCFCLGIGSDILKLLSTGLNFAVFSALNFLWYIGTFILRSLQEEAVFDEG